MNILYNGIDITDSVQPISLPLTDHAGGKPDSLTAYFSDTEGLWSKWNPQKNDTLQVKNNGYDTGVMYIDEIIQSAGVFGLKALSIPQTSKSSHSQAWENVRFLEIASQIASRYGFNLQTYNIINHLYERVDQHDEADFSFLAFRCMLEGYALKINNRTLVIYDEAKEEQKPIDPTLSTIHESDINGEFEFIDKSTDIYQKCLVRSQLVGNYIEGEFSDDSIFGATIKQSLYATNQDEADRWARGILRSYNKHMVTGTFVINLNTNFAAGTSISVKDIGLFDGDYFIHCLTHDLLRNTTRLKLRWRLEGY